MVQYCGFDFGTSNSTLGSLVGGKAQLLPLENKSLTIPTALFYNFDSDETYFGREAVEEYIDGEFGRLMRSIKSVLGTPLMNDTTQIKTKHLAFTDIISTFVKEMKVRAEKASGHSFDQVVMGRPVYFVDEDTEADQKAQNALEKAAKEAGFKEVLFQYEPIAAALDYEQISEKEELALIVDLGGGTSDFSVVRISPTNAKKADRMDDILSTGGVHIGGTDFDKSLSMKSVMPHLGLRAPFEDNPQLEMPTMYHFDLATWHKIHFLYEKQVLISLKALAGRVAEKKLVDRLIKLVEKKEGHRLAVEIEAAKIALTDSNVAPIDMNFVENDFIITAARAEFNDSIAEQVSRITHQAKQVVKDAGVGLDDITKIFMTGGSTSIPLVRESIISLFPNTDVVDGDKFGSVGLGLALDSQRKFT